MQSVLLLFIIVLPLDVSVGFNLALENVFANPGISFIVNRYCFLPAQLTIVRKVSCNEYYFNLLFQRLTRRKPKPRFARSSGSESMEYGADVEDTGVCFLIILIEGCISLCVDQLFQMKKVSTKERIATLFPDFWKCNVCSLLFISISQVI